MLSYWPLSPVEHPEEGQLENDQVVLAQNAQNIEVYQVILDFDQGQRFEISAETRVTDPDLIPFGEDEIWGTVEHPRPSEWTSYLDHIVETYGFHVSNIFVVSFLHEKRQKIGWFSNEDGNQPLMLQHLAEQLVFPRTVVGLTPSIFATQKEKLVNFWHEYLEDWEVEEIPTIEILTFGITNSWWWRKKM